MTKAGKKNNAIVTTADAANIIQRLEELRRCAVAAMKNVASDYAIASVTLLQCENRFYRIRRGLRVSLSRFACSPAHVVDKEHIIQKSRIGCQNITVHVSTDDDTPVTEWL